MDFAQAESSMSLVKQRVSDGTAAAGGNVGALPWAQIIQFILTLLGSGGICPKPTPTPTPTPAQAASDAKAMADQHPVTSQIMLAAAYRKQGFPQPRQLAQGSLSALSATTVDELTTVVTVAQAMQSTVDAIPE